VKNVVRRRAGHGSAPTTAFAAMFIAILVAVGCSSTPNPYAGKWVFKYLGKNFVVLNLKYSDGHYSGSMAMPKNFQPGPDGSFSDIASVVGEEKFATAEIVEGHLKLTAKDADSEDQFLVSVLDRDHVTLGFVGIPIAPFRLVRVSDSETVAVATDWPTGEPVSVSPEIAALQAKLKQMTDEDQAVRKAEHESEKKMEQIDAKNYPEVESIYKKYGWTPISVFGKKASYAYWLLVQHQDNHLDLQQGVLKAMKAAVDTGEASRADYAYLYDRVMMNEGKLQHWGTQTTCKDGKAVMNPVDDPAGLEQRRNELAFIPLDQYLESLEPYCADVASHGPAVKH
jgi:uncharacterized protein DUF6624